MYQRVLIAVIAIVVCTAFCYGDAYAKTPKAKFYDFSEQLIDGEIKRPTTLYTDAREAVRFKRLLKLKKSFLPRLFLTSKEPVFR